MAATPLAAAVPPESEKPPFSFVYGGRPSLELLPTWKSETKSFELDAARTREEFSYTDPATGLAVRAVATVFKDFPAREWVLYFKNTGGADSAILENVCALDAAFTSPKGDPIDPLRQGRSLLDGRLYAADARAELQRPLAHRAGRRKFIERFPAFLQHRSGGRRRGDRHWLVGRVGRHFSLTIRGRISGCRPAWR